MACGTGGCSTGGCGGGCSSGSCNKLNTFDWLGEMELPPHMKPFDIVEVRFKGTRKEFYKNTNLVDVYINEHVVVETENGYDIGKVALKGELVKLQLKKAGKSETDTDYKKLIRKASEADIARLKENQELEVPTMYKARSIAMELGLSMKLSDVEYQGDRRKAVFYYTAEERVDFRELIKRLADSFKVRIEMRQIGYRQEAGRLGGIGSCGRELCCSTWLTDFKMVQTSSARYQNLSLNHLKLSGQCGKLKCCLNFELDAYQEALKEFPEENNLILEFEGEKFYKAVKTDILKRVMWFASRAEVGGEWISLPVKDVNAYVEQNKQGIKPPLVLRKVEPLKPVKVELDFQNDMGIDPLTRLDERDRAKRNNKNRNQKNRNQQGGNQGNRPQQTAQQKNPNQQPNPPRQPQPQGQPNQKRPQQPNPKGQGNQSNPPQNRQPNPQGNQPNPNQNRQPNPQGTNQNPNQNRRPNRNRPNNKPNNPQTPPTNPQP